MRNVLFTPLVDSVAAVEAAHLHPEPERGGEGFMRVVFTSLDSTASLLGVPKTPEKVLKHGRQVSSSPRP
jgi:hypothetical protein